MEKHEWIEFTIQKRIDQTFLEGFLKSCTMLTQQSSSTQISAQTQQTTQRGKLMEGLKRRKPYRNFGVGPTEQEHVRQLADENRNASSGYSHRTMVQNARYKSDTSFNYSFKNVKIQEQDSIRHLLKLLQSVRELRQLRTDSLEIRSSVEACKIRSRFTIDQLDSIIQKQLEKNLRR